MKIIFWHHQIQGPFNLYDLFHGDAKYAGTVTRLRILFWLASTGHEIFLYGNVVDDYYRGVISKSGNDITKFIDSLGKSNDDICLIMNDPPAEIEWQRVLGFRQKISQIILWAASPIDSIWLLRASQKFLDRIIFISSYHQNLYRVYPGIEYSNFIYLGADLDLIESALSQVKTGVNILSLSIPRKTKGFDHLLRAWRIVHKENPQLILSVSGSAKMHEPSAKVGNTRVLDINLEEEFSDIFYDHPHSTADHNIVFLGNLSRVELFAKLKSSDLAIVNSNMRGSLENFCLSAVEAQAAGVPVIGSNAGALKEVINNGVTGMLVNGENPRKLADAIISMIQNTGLRKRMAESGTSWVNPMADYSRLIYDWMEIFNLTARAEKSKFIPQDSRDLLRKLGYGRVRIYLKTLMKQKQYLPELKAKSYEG